MMKWLFWLLLLANLLFFAAMRWGGMLVDENRNLQPQPAFNPEKIKVQSASAVASAVAVAVAQSASAAQSAVQAPEALACLQWGEFSGSALTRATAALTELQLGDRLTQRQVEHTSGYWVYIPPLKTPAEAEKKVGQLKARGIHEYFVIREPGKWQNAISLGVFKTQEAAQKFLAALNAKGVVSARAGEHTSALAFAVFDLKNLDAATVDKVKALQAQFPDSELKTAPCNG